MIMTSIVHLCDAEIFSSVSKMKTLPVTEKKILDKLHEFMDRVPESAIPNIMKR